MFMQSFTATEREILSNKKYIKKKKSRERVQEESAF